MRALLWLCLLLCSAPALAASEPVSLQRDGARLEGTLELPATANKVPVALLIADAGLTNRDGNSLDAEGEGGLRRLALALAARGVASLRYDKRGLSAGQYATVPQLVADAAAWLEGLRRDPRFSRVVIVGHGEGSLIGMLAAHGSGVDSGAAGFVSLNGFGRPAQRPLLESINRTRPADAYVDSTLIVTELEAGRTVTDMEPGLFRYFRLEVQPYLISLFALDPATEFARLTLPALVIRGAEDSKALPLESERLLAANPRASTATVPGMRHDLTRASGELAPGLAEAVTAFVQGLP